MFFFYVLPFISYLFYQYIEWQPGGNSLVIKDRTNFTYGLLHKHFIHHNMDIFIANLKVRSGAAVKAAKVNIISKKIGFMPVGSEKQSSRLEYIHPFGKDLKRSRFSDRGKRRTR